MSNMTAIHQDAQAISNDCGEGLDPRQFNAQQLETLKNYFTQLLDLLNENLPETTEEQIAWEQWVSETEGLIAQFEQLQEIE